MTAGPRTVEPALFDPGDGPAPTGVVAGIIPGPVICRFTTIGHPEPEGSQVPFIDRRTGRARTKWSNEQRLGVWRRAVAADAAVQAVDLGRLDGAVEIDVEFRFPMPKSRPARVRRIGVAPMEVRPDVDKLARAVLDALVDGGLIGDDSQCSAVRVCKNEYLHGWQGADVTVRRPTIDLSEAS